MCLYIKLGKRMANKNIICYKTPAYAIDKKFISQFQNYKYQRGEINPEITLIPNLTYYRGHRVILSGYHSDKRFRRGTHVFVIPYGSDYYEGVPDPNLPNYRQYASSNIIYMGSKWDPFTWLRVWKYNKKQ